MGMADGTLLLAGIIGGVVLSWAAAGLLLYRVRQAGAGIDEKVKEAVAEGLKAGAGSDLPDGESGSPATKTSGNGLEWKVVELVGRVEKLERAEEHRRASKEDRV